MGDILTAVDLGTLRSAKAISAGYQHTCVILDNESVKCWGFNDKGQLGQGDSVSRGDGSNEMGDNLTVIDLGSGRTAASITAGAKHTCVMLDNASIKCWGYRYYGQMGRGEQKKGLEHKTEKNMETAKNLSLIHISRCRRSTQCRSRRSP